MGVGVTKEEHDRLLEAAIQRGAEAIAEKVDAEVFKKIRSELRCQKSN